MARHRYQAGGLHVGLGQVPRRQGGDPIGHVAGVAGPGLLDGHEETHAARRRIEEPPQLLARSQLEES